MVRSRVGGFVGAAALFSSASAFALGFNLKTMLATSEFEDGATRPVSIALLPIQASAVKAKVVDTEALVAESTNLGTLFGTELEADLKAKGYTVEVITPERVNSDAKLQEYVVDANRDYDEMTKRVRRKQLKNRAYKAGDEVTAVLVGIGTTGSTTATLGLVDGHSGVLEARLAGMDSGSSSKKLEEDPQREMASIAELVTAKLPEADPSARVEQADDEDVLSDLEDLLDE
jgi:hypothetical protein